MAMAMREAAGSGTDMTDGEIPTVRS